MTGLDDLELTPTEGGTTLRLRVRAGAQRTTLLGIHAGALKLSVTTAPEKGKANKALIEILAESLNLPRNRVSIEQGQSSHHKIVLLQGANVDHVRDRLALS